MIAAAEKGHTEVSKELIKAKAEINHKTKVDGDTALSVAKYRFPDDSDVVLILEKVDLGEHDYQRG